MKRFQYCLNDIPNIPTISDYTQVLTRRGFSCFSILSACWSQSIPAVEPTISSDPVNNVRQNFTIEFARCQRLGRCSRRCATKCCQRRSADQKGAAQRWDKGMFYEWNRNGKWNEHRYRCADCICASLSVSRENSPHVMRNSHLKYYLILLVLFFGTCKNTFIINRLCLHIVFK